MDFEIGNWIVTWVLKLKIGDEGWEVTSVPYICVIPLTLYSNPQKCAHICVNPLIISSNRQALTSLALPPEF